MWKIPYCLNNSFILVTWNAGFHNPPLDGSDLQTETSKEQNPRETEIKICKSDGKIFLDISILRPLRFNHLSITFLYGRVQKQVLCAKPVERRAHGNRDHKGGVLKSTRQSLCGLLKVPKRPNPRHQRTHEKGIRLEMAALLCSWLLSCIFFCHSAHLIHFSSQGRSDEIFGRSDCCLQFTYIHQLISRIGLVLRIIFE